MKKGFKTKQKTIIIQTNSLEILNFRVDKTFTQILNTDTGLQAKLVRM